MNLVEIFIPLADNDGRRFGADLYEALRVDLTDRFGGVTVFRRAPADGTFQSRGNVSRDEIIVFEVMTDHLDRAWWGAYRGQLETTFEQDEILIRATAITKL